MFEGAPKQHSEENISEIKGVLTELHEKLGLNNLNDFQDERLVSYAKQVVNDNSYWEEAGMQDSQTKLKELLS
jgi:hypothetical protein